jgi:TRAP-type C4-dicarboxylate transport system permease small subunit
MLYALWLFLYGSWNQTVIGLDTYSTVLRFPNAFMASAGLLCAASMTAIVAVNLVRILAGSDKAVVPGDIPADQAAVGVIE